MTIAERIELLSPTVRPVRSQAYLSVLVEESVSVAVPLTDVRETLMLPAERVTAIPNVHPCLLGLLEHRNRIFWAMDLPQLLGFPALQVGEYYLTIVGANPVLLGLAVRRIGRVARVPDELVRSPQEQGLPDAIAPYLRGYIRSAESEFASNVYLLDTNAIATAALL